MFNQRQCWLYGFGIASGLSAMISSAAAAAAAVLRGCAVTVIPPHCNRLVILGVDGNAHHATARTRPDMRPSVLLVVSPSLSAHCTGRG